MLDKPFKENLQYSDRITINLWLAVCLALFHVVPGLSGSFPGKSYNFSHAQTQSQCALKAKQSSPSAQRKQPNKPQEVISQVTQWIIMDEIVA